jgi:arylsulfatase A-like enzyme
VEEKEYLTRAFAREAKGFIVRNKDRPFLLYLPFNAVHAPLEAAPKDLARCAAIADARRRTHAAMLVALDDAVGEVLDTLKELGLDERTLVFFLSDNGGPTPSTTSRNDPFRGIKGQTYEGGIRVPFVVRWKGRVPEGKVYAQPVVSLDIVPTALAAAGIERPQGLDGVDLLPYLSGKDGTPHPALFWRFGDRAAVRAGEWKLVLQAGTAELYRLADDPGETHDLAAGQPDKLKELRAAYEEWSKGTVPARWAGRSPRGGLPSFEEADRNGDGVLTPDELPRPKLFRQLDADGDGKVTPEEFEK